MTHDQAKAIQVVTMGGIMKFIDWFAGVGGFRRGMELAGHECVGFCEFDKFAVASYTSMHLITEEQRAYLATLDLKTRQKEILNEEYRNGEWFADDICRVEPGNVPDADCWCFGFPCQSFSIAGSRRGFEDTRGTLFFEVMRLAKVRHPRLLFAENVAGLLNHDRGRTFATIIYTMAELGYSVEWQVLNSKAYVPQNRERVFIVGHLGDGCPAEVFPLEGTDGADRVHGIGHRNGYRRNTQIFDRGGITEALDTGQGGGRGHHTIEVIGTLDPNRHSQMDVVGTGGVSPSVTTLNEKTKVGLSLSEIRTPPGEA